MRSEIDFKLINESREIIIHGLEKLFIDSDEKTKEDLKPDISEIMDCIEIIKKVGSFRHLKCILPKLIENLERKYKINFQLDHKFISLMNS